jgi:peptide/nickel transport system permease protein
LAVLIGLAIGSVLGAVAGFYGRMIDAVIMRVADTMQSIPFMLLALAIVAALGTGLINVLIALTLSFIPYFVRVIRAAVMTVIGHDFIEAARACGTPDRYIILKHILPNAVGPIIVQGATGVGSMILWAASLSFIGMGIQPPTPEWGAMLSESKPYMVSAPYTVIFPGLAIVLTVLSLNLMGDGLRDALDPRLKD